MSFRIDGIPSASGAVRRFARNRLARRIAQERARRTGRRRRARALVTVLVLLMVLVVAPAGPDGDLAPLLGLADAVAASPPPLEPVARHWYTRSESTQMVAIPIGDGSTSVRFLVTAVEEIWHDGSEQPRRTLSYSAPTFLEPEDERLFHSHGLDAGYPEGSVEVLSLPLDQYAFADDIAQRPPDQVESALRRKVAGVGDQRMEEVHLLRLTTDLMQLHAHDPVFRSKMLRVIADIPGITVTTTPTTVSVSFDYVDGDRPLRLQYEFDAETAHLVRESLAALATRTDPGSILRTTRHSLVTSEGVAGS